MTNAAARRVRSPRVVNVQDFRSLARRRLPKVVFDYLDGGAEDEITLRENRRAFEDVTFRPRHAVAFAECDLRTRLLGCDLALPMILAPIGYSSVMHSRGEIAAARAAGDAGTAYILSTISGVALEDVKAATFGPLFYQLYLIGGRKAAEFTIERIRKAGFSGLFVTIDTAVAGMRERDFRNGMKELISGSIFEKIPFLGQILVRPSWLMSFLRDGGVPVLPNVVIPGRGPMPLVYAATVLALPRITWDVWRWTRNSWKGPLIVRGVLPADDARRAIDAGASAVVVSNHGGRQLDTVQASLRALPEIVSAVNNQI